VLACQVKNHAEEVLPWPESGEIFTGEVPKRNCLQNPLRLPAPVAGKSCGWKFLLLWKKLFFASNVTTNKGGK
jgi:hypothetical protein